MKRIVAISDVDYAILYLRHADGGLDTAAVAVAKERARQPFINGARFHRPRPGHPVLDTLAAGIPMRVIPTPEIHTRIAQDSDHFRRIEAMKLKDGGHVPLPGDPCPGVLIALSTHENVFTEDRMGRALVWADELAKALTLTVKRERHAVCESDENDANWGRANAGKGRA